MPDDRLTALLKPLIKKATRIVVLNPDEDAQLPITGTYFLGTPYAEAGETWPTCPNCKKHLSFVCQINLDEGPHIKPRSIKLFTFFYCWDCFSWKMDGSWVIRTYQNPSIENYQPLELPDENLIQTPCPVQLEEMQSLPDWEWISRWIPEITEVCKEIDEHPWEVYYEKVEELIGEQDFETFVGGYPRWVQGEATPKCNICSSRMLLLAQIDSEEKADIMWGDVGCAYLFYCPHHHHEINGEWQCF